jgi:ribosomal protein S18 acetylase RimI-like enzyme
MRRADGNVAKGRVMNLQLIRQAPTDWPALAPLIHACNRRDDGGVHCLHAAAGNDVAAQTAELAALPQSEAAFWIITQGGQSVGVFGCEFDPALHRAWLRGPLVTETTVLDELLPIVTPMLGAALPGITQFDAFPAADAAALNHWYAAAGYERLLLHRILRAPIDVVAKDAAPIHGNDASSCRVRRARPADLAPAFALHEALFPQSYSNRADFERAIDANDRALFVAEAHGVPDGDCNTVGGFLYVQDSAAEQETYVDHLGVAAEQRGRGLGRELLRAAAAWGAQCGRGDMALTVREDSQSALGLYARAGFVEISAGRHWRRSRSATSLRHPPRVAV